MQQLNLFDSVRRPPVRQPVDRDGDVIQGDVDAAYRLPHPRLACDYAEIELHRHIDGLWMWSTKYQAGDSGGGYRVGPKWGKFAETREDALFYACEELEGRLADRRSKDASLILKWVETIKNNPRTLS